MEHGNVEQFAKPLLDDKTVGRANVFQVDAAKGGAEIAHAIDQRIDVFGFDEDVDAVDIGEALEQDRLALHDRLGRQRAQIAQAENGGAVRHDGNEIALVCQVVGKRRIVCNRLNRHRDPRRVSEA